ncbi:alpha-mannosidase [Oscillatoria sp. FACHB-1406]|uniref:alpha-mannosidase n=1 Tax=Oscillatoria sp. FACHB-1406 TaxID=2692846 RepID=UPI0016874407|nr:alpha-mannosidase [Oscillatoria sp. FACHB-1406]MBD2578924.1 alpha-mannosidase [Oscillatoria sp. FACHB-1406]
MQDLSKEITAQLDRLRQLTQTDVQNSWYCSFQDFAIAERSCPPIQPETWQTVTLNPKDYIVWEAGKKVCWLAQRFVIPHDLQRYPITGFSLRLSLVWWAENVKIFVNGQFVQEGDLFESSVRILLTPSAIPGEEFIVALRLISPGHDIGGLMKSTLIYEVPDYPINPNNPRLDPTFIADELTVLHQYWQRFQPENLPILATSLKPIDVTKTSNRPEFNASLDRLRRTLQPHAASLKERCIKILSHAHLDLAWLWELEETWDVSQRTFESVLNLQKDFPDLTFCHTSPALYEWVENNRPQLFEAIQAAVRNESWNVLGGMWVEPEMNLISGESIARQLLYGQRYTREKFGKIAAVAWLTDSFGFCWQLPQFLQQAGIEYFVTQKLHWNDTTEFPHGAFWWQSPDGSQIFTLMSPPNREGVMDTNPRVMSAYAAGWEAQTGLQESFWLPGVGDKGGGPSRDMLEVQQRWRHSPFFPRLEFTTAEGYLQSCREKIASTAPVWNDELYLEFHRGCYTTHADQKRYNRRCEALLYRAELWSTLAEIIDRVGVNQKAEKSKKNVEEKALNSAPQAEIERAWKKVLFNQFHDILPGTSILEVFVRANRDWEEAIAIAETILQQAWRAIASRIILPPPPHPDAKPLLVFNSLNWERSHLVELPSDGTDWEIYNAEGQQLPVQRSEQGIIFLAEEIPAIGYRLFWGLSKEDKREIASENVSEFILENQILKVAINPQTGDIDRIFDKIHQREVLNGAGNQLQAFQDEGQYWDAWNIDPNYAQHPLPPAQLIAIAWQERGNLRQRLRVIRQLNQSQFTQDYILDTHSPVLNIATTVDWQERHVLVKAAFPLNLEADFATFEIPCGAIDRPTQPQTPAEKAKWEVPALQWADLTSPAGYGASLLNDCKYGYDVQPQQLRLTLLRASMWPHADADRGLHQFTYAVYPHAGSWKDAQTVRRGYELNQPLQVFFGVGQTDDLTDLPPVASLLDLSAENLVLMAFKRAEDCPDAYILRCYECCGQAAEIAIATPFNLTVDAAVDLLERERGKATTIQPWQVVSHSLTLPPSINTNSQLQCTKFFVVGA